MCSPTTGSRLTLATRLTRVWWTSPSRIWRCTGAGVCMTAVRDMRRPNQWPDEAAQPSIAGFRATIEAFMRHSRHASETLMRAMALVLGQPESYFSDVLGFGREPHIRMKIVRYPDESEVLQTDLNLVFHSIAGGNALFYYDNAGCARRLTQPRCWRVAAAPGLASARIATTASSPPSSRTASVRGIPATTARHRRQADCRRRWQTAHGWTQRPSQAPWSSTSAKCWRRRRAARPASAGPARLTSCRPVQGHAAPRADQHVGSVARPACVD